MQIGIKVGDIMTRNIVSVKPDTPVLEAVRLIVKKKVGSLILEEDGILKGILTEKDILWALNKKPDGLKDVKAIDICTRKITTIRPSADIYDALKLMKKTKHRKLPVVVKKKVLGFLTIKDILRIQPELFEIAKEGYLIREHPEKFKRKELREPFKEGVCEECGNFDLLYEVDGKLICDNCRA